MIYLNKYKIIDYYIIDFKLIEMEKYLDFNGLSYFWGKIKSYIDEKINLSKEWVIQQKYMTQSDVDNRIIEYLSKLNIIIDHNSIKDNTIFNDNKYIINI